MQEIFDRYGLVVLGYSGSDEALMRLLRNRNSRYGIYRRIWRRGRERRCGRRSGAALLAWRGGGPGEGKRRELAELRGRALRRCPSAQKGQLPGLGSLISLGAPVGMSCTTTFTRGSLPSFRTMCTSPAGSKRLEPVGIT